MITYEIRGETEIADFYMTCRIEEKVVGLDLLRREMHQVSPLQSQQRWRYHSRLGGLLPRPCESPPTLGAFRRDRNEPCLL